MAVVAVTGPVTLRRPVLLVVEVLVGVATMQEHRDMEDPKPLEPRGLKAVAVAVASLGLTAMGQWPLKARHGRSRTLQAT